LARCHVCRNDDLTLFAGYESFRRVTGDCRPWGTGGRLGVCQGCGAVCNELDSEWHREAAQIYAGYTHYYQSSDHTEQRVFDQTSGVGLPRSQLIFERALKGRGLPEVGRMIDVGCGNGVTLRAFGKFAPQWRLYGLEKYLHDPKGVESIENVEAIFSSELSDVSGTFDLITLMHVFEHVTDPLDTLQHVRHRLTPAGICLIQIPYFPDNPFDLLVADHCTHFTPDTIRPVFSKAGLHILELSTCIIRKEITVVARRGDVEDLHAMPQTASRNWQAADVGLKWLANTLEAAQSSSRKENFGLFGTSTAANWLFGYVGEQTKYFIDEDASRVGCLCHGRPIIHPKDAPADGHVFVCQPTKIAREIVSRLPRTGTEYDLPVYEQ